MPPDPRTIYSNIINYRGGEFQYLVLKTDVQAIMDEDYDELWSVFFDPDESNTDFLKFKKDFLNLINSREYDEKVWKKNLIAFYNEQYRVEEVLFNSLLAIFYEYFLPKKIRPVELNREDLLGQINLIQNPPEDLTKYLGNTPQVVRKYTITDMDSFLGTIVDIGVPEAEESPPTNLVPYVIQFGEEEENCTRVFLSQFDHYAFPIRISGIKVLDYNKYNGQYKKLFNSLSKLTANSRVAKTFMNGTLPDLEKLTMITDKLQAVNALVAPYVCENDRNFFQMVISLLQLGLYNIPVWTAFEDPMEGIGGFPMGGGGWSGKWSWGFGVNPNIGEEQQDPVNKLNVRRWMLSILMNILKDQSPKNSWDKFWVWEIKNIVIVKENILIFNTKFTDYLKNLITQAIDKIRY